MATLSAIEKQIAKLTVEAERLRKKESQDVIAKIRNSIARYGLTPEDLFGPTARAGRGKARPSEVASKTGRKPAGRRGVGVAKYRDPSTGATWTGVGRAPAWIAGVADRSAYLVGGESSVTGESAAEKPRRSAQKVKVSRSATPAKKSRGKVAAEKKASVKAPQGIAKKAARQKSKTGNGAVEKPVRRSNRKQIKAPGGSQGVLPEVGGDVAG